MGFDDLFNKRKKSRKIRSSQQLETRQEKWLFVCEGSETEPTYIKRIIEYYKGKSTKNIEYVIEGTGKNTESLIRSVDDYLVDVNDLKGQTDVPYGKVFTAFDKDSFTRNSFNNAIYSSNKKGYITLWSNECFELWIILHLQFLDGDIGRKQYYKILSDKFNCDYEDNKSEDYFELLDSDKNLSFAYNNAIKLYNNSSNIHSFSDRCPCTMMFLLIDELNLYFNVTLEK